MTDFAATKQLFHLPEGVIYMDGNSLGPLPKSAPARMQQVMQDEWGEMLITGWNRAGWMDQPRQLADRIGRLIGAEPGHVVLGDTLSIKVYQALAAALALRPDRKVILSDSGNFPSDLYMAQGLIRTLDKGHELRVVPPDEVLAHIDDQVAVTLLTEVDYRTGRLHNMAQITEKAHEYRCLTVWDLAHSAGAIPVDLTGCDADFAVGCTYKYLNGGPGAPAFIYTAPRHAECIDPALSGWLGHARPFAFEPTYRAGTGIERMRVGTPPVLAMAALAASLDIWDRVNMADIRTKSIELSEVFISEIKSLCPDLALASPAVSNHRGSQVSFHFDQGYAAMQACIARSVIGDFRAPDIMRFGITPLYLDRQDIQQAARTVSDVIRNHLWDDPAYQIQRRVT